MVPCSSHTRLHADDFIAHVWNCRAYDRGAVSRSLIWCHCCHKANKWTSSLAMHSHGRHMCSHATMKSKWYNSGQRDAWSRLWRARSIRVGCMGDIDYGWSSHAINIVTLSLAPLGKGAHYSWTWSLTTNQNWFVSLSLYNCWKKRNNVSSVMFALHIRYQPHCVALQPWSSLMF